MRCNGREIWPIPPLAASGGENHQTIPDKYSSENYGIAKIETTS
jgi:hypothetical protein